MLEWYNAGYFPMDLMVRRACDNKFTSLTELHKIYGRVPFTPGSVPGPIVEPDPEDEKRKQAQLVQQIQQQLMVQQQLLQHAQQQQMMAMQQQAVATGQGHLPFLGGLGGPGYPSPDPMRSLLGGIPSLSAPDHPDPLKQLLARSQQQPQLSQLSQQQQQQGLTRPHTLRTTSPAMS